MKVDRDMAVKRLNKFAKRLMIGSKEYELRPNKEKMSIEIWEKVGSSDKFKCVSTVDVRDKLLTTTWNSQYISRLLQ